MRKWKGGRYGKGQILLLENSGLLLILSEEGQAVPVAAEPSEHRELASFQALEGKTWNHPVLVGDRLYLRNSQEAAAYRVQLIYLGEQLGAQPFDPTHNACNPSISPVKPKLIAVLLVAFLAPEIGNTEVSSDLPKPGEARMIHFEGALPKLKAKSAELQYDFDLAKETFEIFVPKNYSGEEPFGLFVFIDSQNEMTLPKDWRSALEQRKLICAIPQQVGNDQPAARRMGLAVIGILKTSEQYRIDPKRIVVSGFSGGARCALHLAFVHADLISGSLSICGADFYEPVPKVKAANTQG